MKIKNISVYIATCVIACLSIGKVNASNATYSIITDTNMQHYKRSVDVRLIKKVSKNELKLIANKIKNLERKKYDRIFIAYYLPEMKVNSGAWATTHFMPNLEVKILGLSKDEETSMLSSSSKQDLQNVIGMWADERPYMKSVLTIYKPNKKIYLSIIYKDGSSVTHEMSGNKVSNGMKLTNKENGTVGEYFLIDSKNDLHAGDSEGLFLKYKKVK